MNSPTLPEQSTPPNDQSLDKSGGRIREMFGQIAPRYDFLNHFLSCGLDLWWRRRVTRMIPIARDGGPILDVCAGTGDQALAWLAACRRACLTDTPVIAADFCRPMLRAAVRKVTARFPDAKTGIVEADTLALPFADDRFQIVSVAFGLRNVADTDGGLKEMARVCRPGGYVAVLEFCDPRTPGLKQLYRWYFHKVLPRIGQRIARNRHDAYEYLPESVARFPQRAALEERMQAIGLKDTWHRAMLPGIVALHVGRK